MCECSRGSLSYDPGSRQGCMLHHIGMAIDTLTIPVHGMTCANCARSVERKLSSTPGVTKVTVDLQGGAANVEYDMDLVKPEVLANAVRQLGYEVPA